MWDKATEDDIKMLEETMKKRLKVYEQCDPDLHRFHQVWERELERLRNEHPTFNKMRGLLIELRQLDNQRLLMKDGYANVENFAHELGMMSVSFTMKARRIALETIGFTEAELFRRTQKCANVR